MRTKNEIDKMSRWQSALGKKVLAKYFPDLDLFSRFGTTLVYSAFEKVRAAHRIAVGLDLWSAVTHYRFGVQWTWPFVPGTKGRQLVVAGGWRCAVLFRQGEPCKTETCDQSQHSKSGLR